MGMPSSSLWGMVADGALKNPHKGVKNPMQTVHDELVARCVQCTACRLRLSRRNVAVYRGTFPSPLMIIGEAPGEKEDDQGRPFVGPAGQLLNRLLEQAEVPLEAPYFTNAVKCRPPQNREPELNEIASCRHFLQEQMHLVQPRRIVTLGKVATSAVTGTRGVMSALLASDWTCIWAEELRVIPAYHPSYLLRHLDDPANGVDVQDTIARLKRAWKEAQG